MTKMISIESFTEPEIAFIRGLLGEESHNVDTKIAVLFGFAYRSGLEDTVCGVVDKIDHSDMLVEKKESIIKDIDTGCYVNMLSGRLHGHSISEEDFAFIKSMLKSEYDIMTGRIRRRVMTNPREDLKDRYDKLKEKDKKVSNILHKIELIELDLELASGEQEAKEV